MNGEALLAGKLNGERLELAAGGDWTADNAAALDALVSAATPKSETIRNVDIDMGGIARLDTYGAWLLERIIRGASEKGAQARVLRLPDRFRTLFETVHSTADITAPARDNSNLIAFALTVVGRNMVEVYRSFKQIAAMLGAVTLAWLRACLRPTTFRWTSMVNQVDLVGWRAVPIILLITFLIGAILAQQGIFHFRRFGAEIYVVDMVGILTLRELGVLIVAIMIAGRSGSSYTAELGSMKMREEIDALQTMGLDPIEVLILPRILALVIALPCLAFLGSMAALYGGGLVAWIYGGMSPEIFLGRLQEAISIDHFEVGISKAPFMALVIGMIASIEGLSVKGSAESLGLQTTSSVVKSIFVVIVLDGFFAMLFAAIGK